MGPHGVVLENDADVPALHRHVDAAAGAEDAGIPHINLPGVGLIEAQQAANQGGLAAAGGPHQAKDFAAFNLQAEIL